MITQENVLERVWRQEAREETHALIHMRDGMGLSKEDSGWRMREERLKKYFIVRTDITWLLTGRR